MPAVRGATRDRRRRSSFALNLNPARSGHYGVYAPSPVTFAPNVTPITFNSPPSPSPSPEPSLPSLFPPSSETAPPTKRRQKAGRRLSQGYIPRPPNAFMLFRADFVRQRHIPGSIETSHGTLSKIIANCWAALPPEEKKLWHRRAKAAAIAHKDKYPNYKFKPVHTKKNKDGEPKAPAKGKKTVAKQTKVKAPQEEMRSDYISDLLLKGYKHERLTNAVREFDSSTQWPSYPRRSSSAPPPPIAIQPAPFLSCQYSRPGSPVNTIARSNRANPNYAAGTYLNHRRSSSAQPSLGFAPGSAAQMPWMTPAEILQSQYVSGWTPSWYDQEPSPVPEMDSSVFEKSFLENGFQQGDIKPTNFNLNHLYASLPPNVPISPHDSPNSSYAASAYSYTECDPLSTPWSSQPSSSHSGSPASDPWTITGQEYAPDAPLHAPQPQQGWTALGLEFAPSSTTPAEYGLGMHVDESPLNAHCDYSAAVAFQDDLSPLENISSMYDSYQGDGYRFPDVAQDNAF